jgi:transposase
MLKIDWSDLKELSDSHTISAIAKIKGCSRSTVKRALEKLDITHIKHMYRETPLETMAQIKILYQSHSTYEVAKLLDMSVATVKSCVRRLGIQRNRSQALKLATQRYTQEDCPHDQFLIRTEDGYACLRCEKHFTFDEVDEPQALAYS